MMGRTHFVGGVCSAWPLLLAAGLLAGSPGSDPVTISTTIGTLGAIPLIAGFGALLPDLDARESHLKHFALPLATGKRRSQDIAVKPFALPAHILYRALGHRGLLHSLAGLALAGLLIGLPLSLWLGPPAGLALVLGYASHLLLDACTKTGVPALYPDRTRRHLLPPGFRFVTGSLAEEVLFAAFATLALLLLVTTLGHGGSGSVTRAL